jgi:hypothetical protein
MKTALQDFIDNVIPMHIIELDMIKQEIKKALEKEKEQIVDAYYGNIDGVFGYREEGQEYYNQTYNQTNVGNDGFEFDNSSTIPPPKTNN